MTKSYMIDMETAACPSDGRLPMMLTVGIVEFDPYGDDLNSLIPLENGGYALTIPNVYMRVDIDDAEAHGMVVGEKTLAWWDKQNDAAKYEAFEAQPRYKIKDVVAVIKEFIVKNRKNEIWINGPSFDQTILDNIMTDIAKTIPPWEYWQVKDTRTIFNLPMVDVSEFDPLKSVAHNALYDCWLQIVKLQSAIRQLQGASTVANHPMSKEGIIDGLEAVERLSETVQLYGEQHGYDVHSVGHAEDGFLIITKSQESIFVSIEQLVEYFPYNDMITE